ncbi:MAG: FAD-dependent monooxygenase [Acidobacteriota bacterium]
MRTALFQACGRKSQFRTRSPIYPRGAWWTILRDQDRRYQGALRQRYRHVVQMLGMMPVGRLPAPVTDAAHATSPQLEQGAYLASVDALVLARSLVRHDDVAAELATYTKARRAHLDYYQRASSLLIPAFQSDARLLPFVRHLLMPLACHMSGLRGQMLSTLTGNKAVFL